MVQHWSPQPLMASQAGSPSSAHIMAEGHAMWRPTGQQAAPLVAAIHSEGQLQPEVMPMASDTAGSSGHVSVMAIRDEIERREALLQAPPLIGLAPVMSLTNAFPSSVSLDLPDSSPASEDSSSDSSVTILTRPVIHFATPGLHTPPLRQQAMRSGLIAAVDKKPKKEKKEKKDKKDKKEEQPEAVKAAAINGEAEEATEEVAEQPEAEAEDWHENADDGGDGEGWHEHERTLKVSLEGPIDVRLAEPEITPALQRAIEAAAHAAVEGAQSWGDEEYEADGQEWVADDSAQAVAEEPQEHGVQDGEADDSAQAVAEEPQDHGAQDGDGLYAVDEADGIFDFDELPEEAEEEEEADESSEASEDSK